MATAPRKSCNCASPFEKEPRHDSSLTTPPETIVGCRIFACSFIATRRRSTLSAPPISTCWASTNGCAAFEFISYIDCFDGQHPNVSSPSEIPHQPFTSIEDINNYLLEHKEVVDLIRGRAENGKAGKAVFLFFDEQTEQLCEQLGLEVCFP